MSDSNEKHIELIDRYLSGEMSKSEQKNFEHQLANDKDLKLSYEATLAIKDIFVYNESLELKSDLKAFLEDKKKAKRLRNVRIICAGLLVGLGTYLYIQHNQKTEKSESTEIQVIDTKPTTEDIPESIVNPNRNHSQPLNSAINPNNDKESKEQSITPHEIFIKETTQSGVNETNDNPIDNLSSKENPTKNNDGNPEATQTVNPCINTTISFETKTSASSFDVDNGKVLIKNITGGSTPYTTFIFNGSGETSSTEELAKGSYSVIISDKNGCQSSKKYFQINSSSCSSTKNYSFNPNYDAWTIPFDNRNEANFVLSIYNEGGKLIYEKNFDSLDEKIWDGKNENGTKCEIGFYIYKIKFSDGEICTGNVTLVE
jgi:hypothetical protein